MMKKVWALETLVIAGLILLLLGLLLMNACSAKTAPTTAPSPSIPSTPGEKFVWHYECIFGESDGAWTINSKRYKEMIEQRTNGRIELVLHPADSVVPSGDILEAVAAGTLDCGMAFGPWKEGIIGPVTYFELIPSLFNFTDSYWLTYFGGIHEIIQEAYAKHNLYHLFNSIQGSEWIFTNFAPNKFEDLKGKKIYCSGFTGEWMKKCGASAVDIPTGEVFMALKLGTVDGFSWSCTELETAGYAEVAPYVLGVANSNLSYGANFLINMDRWNELPDDLKAILNEFGQDQWWSVGMEAYTFESKMIEKAKEHYGLQWIRLSPEDEAKLIALKTEVWQDRVGDDPLFDKGWEIVKNYKPIENKLD